MGTARKKKEQFFRQHPRCYFCGRAADSIDHVPNRECFERRVGPEGYEFPACKDCNNSAGKIEQAVALYLHMANLENRSISPQGKKLLQGVLNNSADHLPEKLTRPAHKRRALRSLGLEHLIGDEISDFELAKIPSTQVNAFKRFTRRLICALFYKHIGEIMPIDNLILPVFSPSANQRFMPFVKYAAANFHNVVKARRGNEDIGDQFVYLWYGNSTEKVFAFAGLLANSVLVGGVTCPPGSGFSHESALSHRTDLE